MTALKSSPSGLQDITGRPDLVRLVDAFHAKVRADAAP